MKNIMIGSWPRYWLDRRMNSLPGNFGSTLVQQEEVQRFWCKSLRNCSSMNNLCLLAKGKILFAALCFLTCNVRGFFLIITDVCSLIRATCCCVLWIQAIELGGIWVRGDFKFSAYVWKDLAQQLSGSSLFSCMCILDRAYSYLPTISPCLCVCAWFRWPAPTARDVKQLLFSSIKFNGVIILSPSCENRSKRNRFL